MAVTRWMLGSAAIATVAVFAASALPANPPARLPAPIEITVYRSPSCGCCKAWEDYLRKNGFVVKDILQDDLSQIKAESGVTGKLASCHTALVGGYVVEGHVPAADIQRMLTEKPKIVGISAPGMPGAGPGMDTGKDPYNVLAFDAKGNTTVWAKH
ncbi:MAG TPA: DUF411 domain-containing protein [Gemmatimonadales bacterium]|nr:DUF411 domain-containing protein [Gemmatimonadales bacterium]